MSHGPVQPYRPPSLCEQVGSELIAFYTVFEAAASAVFSVGLQQSACIRAFSVLLVVHSGSHAQYAKRFARKEKHEGLGVNVELRS